MISENCEVKASTFYCKNNASKLAKGHKHHRIQATVVVCTAAQMDLIMIDRMVYPLKLQQKGTTRSRLRDAVIWSDN